MTNLCAILFGLLLMVNCHAQLTDASVEKMKKNASGAQASVPPISSFEGVRTYDACVEKARSLGVPNGAELLRMCAHLAPVAQIKLCERALTANEVSGGKIARALVDCDTLEDIQVWRRSDPPDPNYIDVPKGWPSSVGSAMERFTWRVHTRSRNQEKSGSLDPDLTRESWKDYIVCGARVTRISDIGNGNKWLATFSPLTPKTEDGRARLSVRYSLKPRDWHTDSDLASQTFLFEIYYLKKSSWKEMWGELESPTVKPSVMKPFWANNIKCSAWRAGNDDFAPKPPEAPRQAPVNPFQTIPSMIFWATGEVRCNNGDENFGAYARHSADGGSCESAKAEVRSYFSAVDRCRYQQDRTYPNWSSYPGIKWIRTGTCF